MDNVMIEYRIERQRRSSDMLIKAGVIAAAILFAVLAFFVNGSFLLPAVGCVVAGIIFFPRLEVEFEYLFVAGELTVDCIYARKSRKNAVNYPMNDVELIARENDGRLDAYKNAGGRTLDFTSGRTDVPRYVVICRVNGKLDHALIEPGEEIIKAIYDRYPNKCAR